MSLRQRFAKRAFDLVFAITGLVVFWPVIGVCVIVAARDTGGSGIFSQSRVGRHGRIFDVHKIRTMRAIADDSLNTVTVEHDPRITSAGRVMRRWKLDELPQLWNVLTGEMSFVGPRPDVPGYADSLVGDQRRVLELRPGITGPATIKYRSEEQLLGRQADPKAFNDRILYPDKVRLNLQYLDDWSVMHDVRYILMTLGLASRPASLVPGGIGPDR